MGVARAGSARRRQCNGGIVDPGQSQRMLNVEPGGCLDFENLAETLGQNEAGETDGGGRMKSWRCQRSPRGRFALTGATVSNETSKIASTAAATGAAAVCRTMQTEQ